MFGGTVNAETFRYSQEYFFYISLGIPFYMFGQAMNPVIRAGGAPRFAMISTLAGAVVNILLDPVSYTHLHHLGKARPNGIVDGILHQHLPLGSYAVHLFISTVAGTQSRRHNDQCCLHGDPPEIRRLHSAGAAAYFSVTARGRFDDYTTLPPPLQPFPPGNPRITKSSHPPYSP